MSNFERKRYNPLDLIKQYWPHANTSHITYDPKMRDEMFHIRRGSAHDGTMLFTLENVQRALIPLVNKESAAKNVPPDPNRRLVDIRYTVGDLRYAVVFGRAKLPISETHLYPGQRERVTIPVKCEYIYGETVH